MSKVLSVDARALMAPGDECMRQKMGWGERGGCGAGAVEPSVEMRVGWSGYALSKWTST